LRISKSELAMTDDETRKLKNKVYLLEMRNKLLQARNKELRQWINKLTTKDHPARRAAK
jgi:hypothetical protein